jgi:hypothetical protein
MYLYDLPALGLFCVFALLENNVGKCSFHVFQKTFKNHIIKNNDKTYGTLFRVVLQSYFIKRDRIVVFFILLVNYSTYITNVMSCLGSISVRD